MGDNRALLTISGCTDTGIRRKLNQDYIAFEQNAGIAVLADGMGGHKAGEVASQMAAESVLRGLQELSEPKTSTAITGSQLLNYISDTISDGNSEIYNAADAHDDCKDMGTTIVATVVKDSCLYTGHVGDSRLYLYRDQDLKQLTKDHSLIQSLIDKGFYTEQEARHANVRHIVTRALGTRSDVEVDTRRIEMKEQDVFLLCSDGLTDMISDRQIAETMYEYRLDLDKAASALIDLANSSGGQDNISVILMRAEELPRKTSKNVEVLTMPGRLEITFNSNKLSEVALDKEVMNIGRKADNDIRIENLAVSGHHAKLLTIFEDSFLEDLNSTNGTYVNGKSIDKHPLKNGDIIIIGKHELCYINENETLDADEKTVLIRPPSEKKDDSNRPIGTPDLTSLHRDENLTSASLRIINGKTAGKQLPLQQPLVKLGQAGVEVAKIVRRPDGHFIFGLEQLDEQPLRVNSEEIGDRAVKLKSHDIIEIKRLKIEYLLDN